jgi:hypothetical protein
VIPSVLALVIANLVPIAGVLWFGQDLRQLMLGFWAESAVIGAFAILRMVTATGGGPCEPWGRRLRLVPVFVFHFGGFMAVHGVLVLVATGHRAELGPNPLLDAPQAVLASPAIQVFLLGTALSHGFSFGWHWLRGGERRLVDARRAMLQPYRRIVVQHVALIGGAIAIGWVGSGVLLLVLLALAKIVCDMRSHRREHAGTASDDRAG